MADEGSVTLGGKDWFELFRNRTGATANSIIKWNDICTSGKIKDIKLSLDFSRLSLRDCHRVRT